MPWSSPAAPPFWVIVGKSIGAGRNFLPVICQIDKQVPGALDGNGDSHRVQFPTFFGRPTRFFAGAATVAFFAAHRFFWPSERALLLAASFRLDALLIAFSLAG
jgi:hypothetical protein